MTAPAPAPPPEAAPRPALGLLSRDEMAALLRRFALRRLENEDRELAGLSPLALPINPGGGPPPPIDPADLGNKGFRLVPGLKPPALEAEQLSAVDEAPPALEVPEGAKAPALLPRVRLKLALYRRRTILDVELDADTGALMAWRDPLPAAERGPRAITAPAAALAAKRALPLPEGAGEPDVALRTSGDVPSYEVTWVHMVGPDGDVIVEGDKILARVNATTGRVHSMFRKWRPVGETPPLPDEPPAED